MPVGSGRPWSGFDLPNNTRLSSTFIFHAIWVCGGNAQMIAWPLGLQFGGSLNSTTSTSETGRFRRTKPLYRLATDEERSDSLSSVIEVFAESLT